MRSVRSHLSAIALAVVLFSLPATSAVLDQPLGAEIEPNGTAASATPLAGTNVVVFGEITPVADADYFSFTAAAGDRVYASTMTAGSSVSGRDSVLHLIGSDGVTLIEADNNDGCLGYASSTLAGTPIPTSGTYYLKVFESGDDGLILPYHLYLRLRSGAPGTEIEPNDDAATATPLDATGWVAGTLEASPWARDYYSISLNAGDTISLALDADPERNGSFNGYLGFPYDPNFDFLCNGSASTSVAASEAFYMTVTQAGVYYPFVGGVEILTSGTYQLSVSVLPAVSTAACSVFASTAVPVTLGSGIVTSSVDVTGGSRVGDLDLTLQLWTDYSVSVSLISPAGTTVPLLGVGGTVDLVIDDEAGVPAGIYGGGGAGLAYQPAAGVGRLWSFDGENANGTWTLSLLGGWPGELTAWSLQVCPQLPGILVTPRLGLTTTEAGGTASFTAVLNTQPASDVTMGIATGDATEGTASPSSLLFTSLDWDVPQTVTITGVDDATPDGNIAYQIVTDPATSSDPAYAGSNAADVGATNTDDETSGFTKLQILLPGETAAPGTPTGKTGVPALQSAGSLFTVTVNAVDATWNLVNTIGDTVRLSSNDSNAVLPPDTALANGTRVLPVTLNTAGARSFGVTDVYDATKAPDNSSNVTVNAGAFTQLQILVPGETAAPGTGTGKTGSPTPQLAGATFSVTVNAVDDTWNRVTTVTDTVILSSSDAAAALPANATLVAGTKTFSGATGVELRTVGNWTLTASDVTNPARLPDTSPPIQVALGPFVKLQVLLPGETAAPGTASGKTGTPSAQAAGAPFTITVNAVDANFYLINTVSDAVHITSNDAYALLPPDAALSAGTRTFAVTSFAAATNRTMTASDLTNPAKSPGTSSSVTILAAAFVKLQILVPGETSAPGSVSGKTGIPSAQRAGTPFNVTVNGVDIYWNKVASATDVIHLATTDGSAIVAADAALASGARVFTNGVEFFTPGTWTITASDVTDAGKTQDTTPGIVATLGPFTKLQILVPGETSAPGTASGKTGTPAGQIAGVQFGVTVNAVDSNWYLINTVTDVVGISSSDANAVLPANAPLAAGTAGFFVTLMTAGGRSLTASDVTDAAKAASTTNPNIVVAANAYTKLQVLVPGETAAPGSATGKTGTPATQQVGGFFLAVVNAVDDYWNRITSATDAVQLTSTDATATLPANAPMSGGNRGMNVTLHSVGTWTVTASDMTPPSVMPGTSAGIPTITGPFARLLVLGPGESLAPGTVSGKTGTALEQIVGVPFTVTVYACTLYYYPVATVTDTIHIASNDPYAVLPVDAALVNGVQTFQVVLKQAGGRFVSASDVTNGAILGSDTYVVVQPGAFSKFQILLPGEVSVPGSPSGRTGIPAAQVVGDPFSVEVRAVDDFWNVVPTVYDVVALSSTDPAATLPHPESVKRGMGNFPVQLGSIGSWTITANYSSNQAAFTFFPAVTGRLRGIGRGPDGNIWYTAKGIFGVETAVVGKMTPTGVVSEYLLPLTLDDPDAITAGPDGNVWFAADDNVIGRIAPNGTGLMEFSVGSVRDITSGPDGNLWFTSSYGGNVGRITTAGTITVFNLGVGGGGGSRNSITTGADGKLWHCAIGLIARVDTDGSLLQQFDNLDATGIVTGPDSAMWTSHYFGMTRISGGVVTYYDDYTWGGTFIESAYGRLWAMRDNEFVDRDVNGTIRAIHAIPLLNLQMRDSTVAADGSVWFAMTEPEATIGRMEATTGVGAAPDTSTPVNTALGPFARLQILLPGETAAPGTSTGKTGTPTVQTAGTPFNVTVNAVTGSWYPISGVTDVVRITSSDAYAVLPADAALVNSTATFQVTLRTAGTRSVTASDISDPAKNPNSGSLAVVPAAFTKLQILVPGETAAPGSATGKTGTPTARTVSAPFNATVNAVDDYWNLVSSVTDTIHLASTDAAATLPADTALAGGTRTVSIELQTVGTWTVTVSDVSDGTKLPDTSPGIPVVVGTFTKLQLLVPGETAAPGTPTGKIGVPLAQTAGVAFSVTVNAVDASWYPSSAVNDTVRITSSDAYAVLPADAALAGGTQTFSVTLVSGGATRTITASDMSQPTKGASTSPGITVNANTFTKIQLLVPGETAAPGSPTGKTGTPANQNISTNFSVTVRAADDYWNVVPAVTDLIHLASDEPTATIPADAVLVGGTKTFTGFRLNQLGNWTITASDLTDGSKLPVTSPPISVTLGTFTKMQILVPGETAAPGTPTGKTGTPNPQIAGVPFDIIVNSVDPNWYVIGNVTDVVHLASTDVNAVLAADTALNGGTVTLSVTLRTAGNRTITASDVTQPAKTANTSPAIAVVAGPSVKLQILVPGETAAPGTATGKTGAPTARSAGAAFTITVKAVDDVWNLTNTVTDTVHIDSTDAAAILPGDLALVAGTRTYTNGVEFRTQGTWTLTASDITDVNKLPDTSPPILVNIGPFTKLQVLLPGETAAAGTTSGKTGTASPQVVGVPFNVTVNAVDANWYLMNTIGDVVQLASSDANAILGSPTPLFNGSTTFTVELRTSGTRTVTASDVTDPAKTANTSSNITVATGTCSKLQILVPGETASPGSVAGKTGTPTNRVSGAAFNIIINAVDDYWNKVNSVTDEVTLTTTDATAVIPANATLTAGTRTFTTFEFRTVGTWTITVADVTTPSRSSDTTPPINVVLGAFTKLQVLVPGETAAPGTASGKTGTPNPQTAGAAFPVTVNAVDANWNLINTVSDTVHLVSNDPYAVLPLDAALVSGTTSMSVVLKKGGTRTVTASDVTDPGKTANTSSNITVVANAFTKMQILVPGETADTGSPTGKTGAPTPRTAGAPFSVTVNAVDDYWNRVTTITDVVSMTSSDAAAFLPANAALAAGTRTYTAVELRTEGTWTLTATDVDNASISSNTSPGILVILGPFSKLQVLLPGETADPGTATGKAGTPDPQAVNVAFDVTVRAVDANWNLINTVSDLVHLTSSDPFAILPADAMLAGGTQLFTVTFRTSGTRTVTASDVTAPAITANTSSNITVASGAFTKLQILVPGETAAPGSGTGKTGTPSTRLAGAAFSVTVNAVDNDWNRVLTVVDVVGLSSTDATAFLPANAALVAGTKTFTTVELRTVGSWTLTASDLTAPAVPSDTSPPIPVVIGNFTKLQILLPGETSAPGTTSGKTGTPSPQMAGVPLSVTVNAVDPNWNLVDTITDNVAITSSDPDAVLPPNAPLVAGTQNFSFTFRTSGTRTITASDADDPLKTPNTSPNVTVTANLFTKLQILVPGETADPGSATGKTGTPTPATAGTPFSVTVRAVDDYWNLTTTINHTVAVTSSDTNATLPANAALAGGTRTFTNGVTLRTAGTQTLTATDVTPPNGLPNSSPPIQVDAGAFLKLQILVPGETAAPGTTTGKTGLPANQAAGVPFNVTVNAVDTAWNLTASVADTVHIASSDAGATLPADDVLVAGTQTFSVTLSASGTLTASDVTTPAILPDTSPIIPLGGSCDATKGDLNETGTVNAGDSVILANFLVGNLVQGVPPFTAPLSAADLNNAGGVNSVDAVILANFLVGNISCLPI